MIKKFLNEFYSIDKKIFNAIKLGNYISFSICIVSIVTLIIYYFNPISYFTYQIATLLFKSGLLLFVDTVISGFICDKLRKQFV